MPANLLEQVRCSRFRHESVDWEHVGHRWRGVLALFDFQLPLWPSTISFARAQFCYAYILQQYDNVQEVPVEDLTLDSVEQAKAGLTIGAEKHTNNQPSES
jgi:hypothetical protein